MRFDTHMEKQKRKEKDVSINLREQAIPSYRRDKELHYLQLQHTKPDLVRQDDMQTFTNDAETE